MIITADFHFQITLHHQLSPLIHVARVGSTSQNYLANSDVVMVTCTYTQNLQNGTHDKVRGVGP